MFKKDLILREEYINYIRPFIDVSLVKIIVGVRRSGKSYIIDMIGDELIHRKINKDHIIYRLYTDIELSDSYDIKGIYEDLKSKIEDDEKYYFLLDEIQEVDGWEKVINTLFEKYNVDIYVAGSNSKLTSEKISTYLSGRYILIPTYTLSFKEYIKFKGKNTSDLDELFKEYMRFGGFPLIASLNFDTQKSYQIVDDIYHSIINRDVVANHPIKEVEKFNRIVNYLMDNMGKTFSANSLTNYLKSQKREISVETVYNYISWLKDSFIIYECKRYDLQGKTILKTLEKYYLSDISLRYAIFGYNKNMDDAILENIIFLELKRRGYNVYIGKNGGKEIDFIAKRRDEEIQIQATLKLPSDSNREIKNREDIKDFNHKYIVTTNRNDEQNINGIRVIHVVDFLLMENW